MDSIPRLSSDIIPASIQAGFTVSDNIASLVIIFILIACSALVSASEVAFFSLSPSEKKDLEEEHSRSSKAILKLLSKPKDLLASILITNNFINVCIIILSTGVIDQFFPNSDKPNTLRFLIEVVGISTFLLLLGEVAPKLYASRNTLSTARFMANPIIFINILPPFSWLRWLLVNGTNMINKRAKKRGINLSSDDLEHALALTKEDSDNEDEHRILEGIIKFGNTEVRQIMKSRLDLVTISSDATFREVLDVILDAGYSRIPIHESSFDNVIGILYIKDLLPYINNELFEWKTLLRKAYFIPENKKIDDLLKEFQDMKMHMAIVVDEYGGSSGLVTLEDVLEEIVGDITDEFDDDDLIYTKIDDQTYLFEGRTSLVDFYKVLEIDGKDFDQTKGESDTIGGFIIEQAGRILRNNEYIRCGNIKLIVESSDKRRIKMIKTILEND
ncbi:gliding motility-associated protein GldE [Fluviicola taffensis]|uniref:Gliding motility-associated protein GldE n=1 Tax=Fluviicola taffensis (strain DSM 16823 / NCIMB 13979 / RW262) TaxID=755732 RepID=F2IBW5_FLUTR|nr:gliding motility-associated protein GldE [Fluviicola taffensis]AEA42193.1 gliding motility-associated protein GldE [Fluviicola taffensis DSM 16823]